MIDRQTALPLVGYSDRLSLRPGETIAFKVSSTLDTPYTATLLRSISADPNPDGMGIVEQPLDHVFPPQTLNSRYQPFYPGSYAITEQSLTLDTRQGFKLTAAVFPTLAKATPQTVLAVGDLALVIDGNGALALGLGHGVYTLDQPLALGRWYCLEADFNPAEGTLWVRQIPLGGTAVAKAFPAADLGLHPLSAPVTVAATWRHGLACQHFNGKIEAPALYGYGTDVEAQPLVHWDFSAAMAATTARDTGPLGLDLTLVNFPTRAVTGIHWDGSEMCWRHRPDHYGAIYFHQDDICDFGWETDFTFTVPDDLPSGVYVMRLGSGDHWDAMPFFVCAPRGQPRASLCVLIPTFTYTVYGNHARPDYDPSWQARSKAWGAYPHNPAQHRAYGLSTYNYHPDGSGICHACHRRPLLTLRPGYLTFGSGDGSGLRHFQADSHLISWLHAKAIDYDVITDHELHHEGVEVLAPYRGVATTTHPEYHTPATLDGLQAYRDHGGHLLYLGGNGFYWRIALHPQQPQVIEIRRAEGGIRAWAAEPGEYYHAFDGGYGGLWRRNGRPPQRLVGVGFTAQGTFKGTHYRRVCFDPALDWLFAGIDDDIVGGFGYSGGGAAGYELDRVDGRLGSPEQTVVLARSEAAADDFVLVPEEQLTHITTLSGEAVEDLLRADMVYFELPGGGSVFAVGSITFCGSLPWNGFSNDVSTLLENVVRRCLAP